MSTLLHIVSPRPFPIGEGGQAEVLKWTEKAFFLGYRELPIYFFCILREKKEGENKLHPTFNVIPTTLALHFIGGGV